MTVDIQSNVHIMFALLNYLMCSAAQTRYQQMSQSPVIKVIKVNYKYTYIYRCTILHFFRRVKKIQYGCSMNYLIYKESEELVLTCCLQYTHTQEHQETKHTNC